MEASGVKRKHHDGKPLREVDHSHLSALPQLLRSGGKERYVRQLLLHIHDWAAVGKRHFLPALCLSFLFLLVRFVC